MSWLFVLVIVAFALVGAFLFAEWLAARFVRQVRARRAVLTPARRSDAFDRAEAEAEPAELD